MRSWGSGAGAFAFTLMFGITLVFFTGVPGILAIKRRWEEFVKILGMIGCFALFAGISTQTRELAAVVEKLCGSDHVLLGVWWGPVRSRGTLRHLYRCLQTVRPLIVRRIYRSEVAAVAA